MDLTLPSLVPPPAMPDAEAAPTSFHMSSEDFRRHACTVVDWIARYQERVETLPVLSRVAPGSIRAALPTHAPQKGESFEAMMDDVEQIVLPGITHWQSPNFFAFFPGNTSGPSILGELLCAGLGVQGMLWVTSPACTELETQVLEWFAKMLGLPERFSADRQGGGVIQDSACSGALCALIAARERATGHAVNRRGADGRLVAYTTGEAHSSIEKAVGIAGIGRDNLRRVEMDEHLAMRPDALRHAIARDLAQGLTPFFVSATIGTTSSNAVDPIAEIGRICRLHGLWLHVDAAMAGPAAICPEHRYLNDGLGLADSYCTNPHKWMFTNFDCDCFYVADRQALIRALSVLPEYLRNEASAGGEVFDYRDWQVSLGRRFRALKLWFVIRHYGVEGLQHHIRRHIVLAREFARWVEEDRRFVLAAAVPLNLVCLRHVGGDAFNEALLHRLNASGKIYLSHTRKDGRFTLRFCVGQSHSEMRHVAAAWRHICAAADELSQQGLHAT